MRTLFYAVSCSLFIGCAGQPSAPPPAAAQAPERVVNATGTELKTVSLAEPDGKIDDKRLVDAHKAGYTLVNKDGEALYCRTQDVTGSHVRKETQCLTAKQIDDMHEQTQAGFQQYMHPNAPIQGR